MLPQVLAKVLGDRTKSGAVSEITIFRIPIVFEPPLGAGIEDISKVLNAEVNAEA